MALSLCDTCYQLDTFAPCASEGTFDEITLPTTDLTGDTEYALIITDKHGNQYAFQVTTESDGSIILTSAMLATMLDDYNIDFNYASGGWEFVVRSEMTDTTNEDLITVGDTTYSCIVATFKNRVEVAL